MTAIKLALATLRAVGFTLPHLQGLFRHPLLDAEGAPVDPTVHGFSHMDTGGGCEALVLQLGQFSILLTGDDGASIPEPSEWADALIGVYRDFDEEREEVALFNGLQWLEMAVGVDFDTKTAAELSAWYVETVGYDPMEDDPSTEVEDMRGVCKELALIDACGGVDSPAYHDVEYARRQAREAMKPASRAMGM
ncbi:hypothetical protein [Pseudomonas sp.]|uniref:hypothetical protein n=1 Tax=Pseudomonas sp. TaxID=306 RepID=UPI00290C3A5D|nr:hypothetical protein [Pseudomonas sp.]MDU4254591.1 hypothetical protein [Pseudomonas sp.]